MKKIFGFVAVAAALLVAGNANAQLGINVGYAPQTYTTVYTNPNNGNQTSSNSEMNGFFAGVNYNMPISGDLCLSLGAQMRYNSDSDENTTLGVTTKVDMNQMILDIPILFNYGLNLTSDLKLSAFVGPTVNFAMSGKTTATVTGTPGGLLDGETESDWYGDNGNYKNLELGGTIGLCISYTDFRLFGGYNMGLMNINKNDNYSTKGSNIFFGVGYAL